MRRENIAPGEHYHLVVRGNHQQVIFKDDLDRARLLFAVLYFQSPLVFNNIRRYIDVDSNTTVQHRVLNGNIFDVEKDSVVQIAKERFVELVGFTFMSNHLHFLVREVEEGGIGRYMQRVLDSYSKYYNAKYETSGHLLQGPYKAVHISSNRQLLYVSAYIHRNPREIRVWKYREHQYPWSSYIDYIKENRWEQLLLPDVILGQFKNRQRYIKDCIQSSGAKESDYEYKAFVLR